MSRKVVKITNAASKYDILSQTPKNYNKDNYFLKELQHKVDAEWDYRPNRVDVEYETEWGEQRYEPIEVVIQSVLSEKGTAVSNDTRNIVFRNILEDRFNLGNRFRFSEDYDLSKQEDKKNVWMVVNLDKVSMTSSVIVERCNNTLGSILYNDNGTVSYHYEPVVMDKSLTSVNFFYNDTLINPQSQLLVIAQHNKYTRQYKINQRFIVGYDKVYRIKAINNSYSSSTFDPEDVGLIRIYMEITESSPYDLMKERIAYNGEMINSVPVADEDSGYSIQFASPKDVPLLLPTSELIFEPVLYHNNEQLPNAQFSVSYELANLLPGISPDNYVIYKDNADGTYSFTRVRGYSSGNLVVTFFNEEHDVSVTLEFTMIK